MIYLDNAATTKPFDFAAKYAFGYAENEYFNPSALYSGGLRVKEEINKARKALLAAFPSDYDLIFTSCGTEADNAAIFSFARRGNAVTTLGEHSAVYESFKELKNRGVETRFAFLNKSGGVNVEDLLSKIDENTAFVSIVHVNNETGAINDINEIAKSAKKKNPNVIFHSDGVQAFCKINYKIDKAVDLYSVSAHKINAFKGTGAIIKKRSVRLNPYLIGGGQESGLRSGTENVFGILSFYKAAEFHLSHISENVEKFKKLKEIFINTTDNNLFEIISDDTSSPHIICLSAKGMRGEVLQRMMDDCGVIIGTGSACSSKSPHSRILKNCGYSDKILDGAIRISFSAENSEEEVYEAALKLNECAEKLSSVMKIRSVK